MKPSKIVNISLMSAVVVGISGWRYKGWRGTFYPKELAQKNELRFAGRELPTIEINGTFYSLQRPSSFMRWYDETPDDFIFAVKANRYITHIKRLNDIEIPLANFFASGILALKEKLGPILWQFPPSMSFDPERFEKFLSLLPKDFHEARVLAKKTELSEERQFVKRTKNYPIRHAVEVRNTSFLNPWFVELLRKYNVAIVFADTAGKWPYLEDVTADFVYLRLHGDAELYVSGYDHKTLEFWSERIQCWKEGHEPKDHLTLTDEIPPERERDVYVYFDNDAKVRAPVDAKDLIKQLGDHI
jgi:uncharacterized protein YecE (DUF72 family)